MFSNVPNIHFMLMVGIAILIALTVHEYAHARAALAAGDNTAKLAGRLTLNPLAHLDPVGTVLLVLMMFGISPIAWGKPVPVNPMRFKSPRWDNLKVSLWGPASNFILAVLFALIRIPIAQGAVEYLPFIHICIRLNLALGFFNLIPIPPLDGSHILASLLPYDLARRYEYAVGKYGMLVLIVMLLTGAIGYLIYPPIAFFYGLLT